MIEPRIYFTLHKKGGRVIHYKNSTKQRIARLIASPKTKLAYVRGRLHIVYGKDKGELITNTIEGDISDMKWGLNAFLEKDLWLKN